MAYVVMIKYGTGGWSPASVGGHLKKPAFFKTKKATEKRASHIRAMGVPVKIKKVTKEQQKRITEKYIGATVMRSGGVGRPISVR